MSDFSAINWTNYGAFHSCTVRIVIDAIYMIVVGCGDVSCFVNTGLPHHAIATPRACNNGITFTSVLGHFGLFLKVRSDQGPKCLNHFGTRDRSGHRMIDRDHRT